MEKAFRQNEQVDREPGAGGERGDLGQPEPSTCMASSRSEARERKSGVVVGTA